MGKKKDLTGLRYGRLLVLEDSGERTKDGNVKWNCICNCGKNKEIDGRSMTRGLVTSCGCVQLDSVTKHGMSYSKEHATWRSIKDRCHNPKHPQYHRYGGRGITMCEEWRDSFEKFYSDLGPKPKGMTIERKDNNKGYCIHNVTWATPLEQAQNRGNNRYLTLNGESHTVSVWSRITGISVSTLWNRLSRGWTDEQCLTIPTKGNTRKVK